MAQIEFAYEPGIQVFFAGTGRLWKHPCTKLAKNHSVAALRDSAVDLDDFEFLIGGRSILWALRWSRFQYVNVYRDFADGYLIDEFNWLMF